MRNVRPSRLYLLFVVWVSTHAVTSSAQVCDYGTQVAFLDAGSARVPATNYGVLLIARVLPGSGPHEHYVSDRHPDIIALSDTHVGVGGYANGELRMTRRFYGKYMLPGSLDENGMPLSDSTTCSRADRIYQVSASDFAGMDADETASEQIAEWPAHLSAPVIDGDGVLVNYNVEGGHPPALIGDEIAWWQ